jgi:hypothetical protein
MSAGFHGGREFDALFCNVEQLHASVAVDVGILK